MAATAAGLSREGERGVSGGEPPAVSSGWQLLLPGKRFCGYTGDYMIRKEALMKPRMVKPVDFRSSNVRIIMPN